MIGALDEQYVPLSLFADKPLRLDPIEYPNDLWNTQRANYELCWAYYKGYILNKKAGDRKTLLYPVKLNIVRSAVINHAAVLLGQFEEDSIVQFGLKTSEAITPETRKAVIKALNFLWASNDGDDSLLEQSLYQQIFGGCFWKIAWTPTRMKWPIRYFAIDPRAVYPVWDGNDYNRLVSIDVQYQVPRPTAVARYRVEMPITDTPEYVTVHEHWDEAEYFIRVDDRSGQWPDGSEMAGPNPWFDPIFQRTVIPYVYAPRIRVGDGIYGEPLPPGLMGPMTEINNNLAHLQEGLADSMHQQPWVKNRPKGTQGLTKSRNEWLDLGMGGYGNKDPEAGRLAGARLDQAAVDLVTDDMVRLAREHVNLPDVAWGRTDASIRSALTLKFMMWPTINLGMRYRKSTSTALKYLNYTALVMAFSKRKISENLNGVSSLGLEAVTEEMIEAVLLAHKTEWPPMLPDDRAELVNEVTQRLSGESPTISPETAIKRLDGSDELEEELNRIDQHREKMAEIASQKLEEQHELNMEATAGKEEAKAKAKPPKDQTNKAQAAGGRAKGTGK